MSGLANKKVLIAEDEIALREILAEMLSDEGAITYQAGNAVEACKLASEHLVDAVLSDVRMSGGDGIELLEKLRSINPTSPPLIFMTGYSDLQIQDAYSKGAEGVVAKPFKIDGIKKKILEVMLPQNQRYLKKSDKPFNVQITEKFKSLEDVAQQGKMKLGRGGFFINGNLGAKVGDLLQFNIMFEKGTPSLLQGEGIVRWVISSRVIEKELNYGVEFSYFSEECGWTLIPLIESLKDIPFIPKEN
jgi:two-component system response regulator (stage 0 sporulation protein F)